MENGTLNNPIGLPITRCDEFDSVSTSVCFTFRRRAAFGLFADPLRLDFDRIELQQVDCQLSLS